MVIKLQLIKVERRRLHEIGIYGEGLMVEGQGPRGDELN